MEKRKKKIVIGLLILLAVLAYGARIVYVNQKGPTAAFYTVENGELHFREIRYYIKSAVMYDQKDMEELSQQLYAELKKMGLIDRGDTKIAILAVELTNEGSETIDLREAGVFSYMYLTGDVISEKELFVFRQCLNEGVSYSVPPGESVTVNCGFRFPDTMLSQEEFENLHKSNFRFAIVDYGKVYEIPLGEMEKR